MTCSFSSPSACLLFLFISCCAALAVQFEEAKDHKHTDSIIRNLRARHRANPNPNHDGEQFAGKMETVCIMTRDHVCLSSNVYYPATVIAGPYSTIYENTPYGKASIDGDHTHWNALGFVFIAQDSRGRSASNGTYEFFTNVGNDSLDSVAWIVSQPWSDGNLATIGISADALGQYGDITGVAQYSLFPDTLQPELYAKYNALYQHILVMQPSLGTVMGYQMVFQGGAYRQGLTEGYLTLIGESAYIPTVVDHEVFGPYWYPMSEPFHSQWNYFNQSVIHLAGWYDIFSTNQIFSALHINDSSARTQTRAEAQQILIIEPGGHCPQGDIYWPNASYGTDLTSTLRAIAFSAAFNASNANAMDTFNIHDYFSFNVLWYQLGPGLSGEEGNFWIAAESFPEYTLHAYYLASNGALTQNDDRDVNAAGVDSYLYNPWDPVRTWGGNNMVVQPCGPWDQTHNENGRTDILHYYSPVLTETLYLVGLIEVQLFVSSSAVDTDFTAKVVDVFPAESAHGHPNENAGGVKREPKHMLVQDGIVRMRWRNAKPYANVTAPHMVQGQVYNITVEVGYMSYTFNAGHRIGLSISSSNYKRFNVNYNSGKLVVDGDTDGTNATNSIYYGTQYPSKLTLPVVENQQWIKQRRVQL